VRYCDLKRHWTKRIKSHLGDENLNAIDAHEVDE
jgi:hypothetical protein